MLPDTWNVYVVKSELKQERVLLMATMEAEAKREADVEAYKQQMCNHLCAIRNNITEREGGLKDWWQGAEEAVQEAQDCIRPLYDQMTRHRVPLEAVMQSVDAEHPDFDKLSYDEVSTCSECAYKAIMCDIEQVRKQRSDVEYNIQRKIVTLCRKTSEIPELLYGCRRCVELGNEKTKYQTKCRWSLPVTICQKLWRIQDMLDNL